MCSHSVFPQGWSDDGGFFSKGWRQWGASVELKCWECCAATPAPRGQQVLFTCWQRWRWSILSGDTACPWCDAWTGSGAGRRRNRCSVCIHHTQTGTGSLGIQGTGNPRTWETWKGWGWMAHGIPKALSKKKLEKILALGIKMMKIMWH